MFYICISFVLTYMGKGWAGGGGGGGYLMEKRRSLPQNLQKSILRQNIGRFPLIIFSFLSTIFCMLIKVLVEMCNFALEFITVKDKQSVFPSCILSTYSVYRI